VPGSGHGRAALQIKSCRAANQILPRRKSNLAAGFLGSKWSGSKPATFSTFTLNGIVPRGIFSHLLV
jgi:hypothetical protein